MVNRTIKLLQSESVQFVRFRQYPINERFPNHSLYTREHSQGICQFNPWNIYKRNQKLFKYVTHFV